MKYYGIEIAVDDRLRPGVIRVIQLWLGHIDWPWPRRKKLAPPRRPFDHGRDRWCW